MSTEDAKRKEQILGRFTQLCTMFIFPVSEERQIGSPGCFLGPEDLASVMQVLSQEFSEEELTSAGIVEQQSDGGLRLLPELGRCAGPFMALHATEGANPFSLLTDNALQRGSELPILSILRDYRTRELLKQRNGLLLLTPTVESAAVLCSLTLAAAPFHGIDRLGKKGLEQLARTVAKSGMRREKGKTKKRTMGKMADGRQIELMDGHFLGEVIDEKLVGPRLSGNFEEVDDEERRTKRKKVKRDFELEIILTCWHPAGCSEEQEAQVRQLARYLAMASRVLDVDLGDDVGIWHPSAREQRDLAFATKRGDRVSVWRVVRDSIESSTSDVASFADPEFDPTRSPSDFEGASALLDRRIAEDIQGGISAEQWSDCLGIFGQMVNRDLVQPLNKRAMETSDPVQRVLYQLAAENARVLHLQTPTVRRQLAEIETGGRSAQDENVLLFIEQQRRTSNELLGIIKVLRG